FGPYPNRTSWELGSWFHSVSPEKSQNDFNRLLGILLSPTYSREDLVGVPWTSINRQLAFHGETGNLLGRGWKCSEVTIRVPTGEQHPASSPLAEGVPFVLPEFYHRSIPALMDTIFGTDLASERFQHIPFEQYWAPHNPSWPRETVLTEFFSSPTFLRAHDELQQSPPEPNCTLPRVIAGMFMTSDSMRLTSFGHASLWPGYVGWVNQTMYERLQLSSSATHPICYFLKLPDIIHQFMRDKCKKRRGKKKNDALVTHLRHELFHACLRILFEDPDFRQAYLNGRVIKGRDGVTRRHYLRLFSYSADYPEKTLISLIRNMGGSPMPQNLVTKDKLHLMGTVTDMLMRAKNLRENTPERVKTILEARKLLYKKGYVVNSKKIEGLLKPESWVPSINAFSWLNDIKSPSILRLLTPDIMHEWELGVWKAIFVHLIRILHTQGYDAVIELCRRYRECDPFGTDGIRRFPENIAELSHMTAQDFEDALLVSVPCFDRLINGPAGEFIRLLLFRAGEWHVLVKLKMHTTSTLCLLHNATIRLGMVCRQFRDEICPQFATVETPSETRKRQRNAQRAQTDGQTTATASAAGAARPKTLNLNTPKFWGLGEYPERIANVGVSGSYSTRIGESAHRIQKAHYSRTSQKDATKQIVGKVNQQETLREISQSQPQKQYDRTAIHDEEKIIGDPTLHHIISHDDSKPLSYGKWQRDNSTDQGLHGFLTKLVDHLAYRLTRKSAVTLDVDTVKFDLSIQRERIFETATARINYTSYDVRRRQDTINVNSGKRDIMALSHDVPGAQLAHPFRFARVHRVFHAYVTHPILSLEPTCFEFLFVRWFEALEPPQLSWERSDLERVRFVPVASDEAFGFLDPGQVLRACHLIPCFADGRTKDYLGPSMFRDQDGDYVSYYVGQYV
ncbi:hypothetical protein EXIGLDRAFT_563809, partial [Exidia glandulosa HHB12029]